MTQTRSRVAETTAFIGLAAAFALFMWWLLSDREPTQNEMTFAYRKHVMMNNEELSAKELADLRQRLHAYEFIKQRCDKLGDKRYRCEAIVLVDDHPIKSQPAEANAIYSRDAKGWQIEAINKK